MEFVIKAAVVLVLALCLGTDIAIVPIMLMVFSYRAVTGYFRLLYIFGCKTCRNEKHEREVCAYRQSRGQKV